MGSPWYKYVFVRRDLSEAQRIIQVGHACYEVGQSSLPDTPNMVLFEVAGEAELIEVSRQLDVAGVKYAMFFEPDHDTGYTALCTYPVTGEERRVFANYSKYTSTES